MDRTETNITQLLSRFSRGDRSVETELIEIVFPQLRQLAARYMRSERHNHTLQPTALVHEAYLRLLKIQNVNWENHAHFFGVAAKLMRQILVDYARAHNAEKRNAFVLSLDEALIYSKEKSSTLLAVDEALRRLAAKDERACKVVELRFFGGLTFDQIGRVLKVSEKTAKRDWQFARAWLNRELHK